jgi:HK97 family phage major capsid protein
LVGQVLIRGELGQQLLAPSLWGKPIAVSKSAVPGTALVGAFSAAAQLFRRTGLLIEGTNCNEDDFVRNLMTIRAELRAALAVYDGSGFCEVTGLP